MYGGGEPRCEPDIVLLIGDDDDDDADVVVMAIVVASRPSCNGVSRVVKFLHASQKITKKKKKNQNLRSGAPSPIFKAYTVIPIILR